jgi:hypothetical protein
MSGEMFDFLDFDVTFDSISVLIVGGGAHASVTFSGAVTVGGYTAASATITVDSTGISMRGAVSDVKIGDVTISQAALEIELHKQSSGVPSSFQIIGVFDVVSGLQISVGLSLLADDDGKLASWSVYGEVDGSLRLSKIAPFLSSVPDLDMELTRVAVIASSDDQAAGSIGIAGNRFNYPVKKGEPLPASNLSALVGAVSQLSADPCLDACLIRL